MFYIRKSWCYIGLLTLILTACWTPEGPANRPLGQMRCDGNCSPSEIDTDGDCITDLLEENPTNVDLYNFDIEECNDDPSRAVGLPDAGSLEGGLNLRDQGTGYIHHLGTDAADSDDWGTLELCRCIELAARDLGNFRRVRLQVGDMSLKNGGYFSPHASHQNGIDADMRYMRNDREDVLDLASSYERETFYDKHATLTAMVRMIDRCDVQYFFTDPSVIGFTNEDLFGASNAQSNEGWLRYSNGHTNHFHLRIHQPTD